MKHVINGDLSGFELNSHLINMQENNKLETQQREMNDLSIRQVLPFHLYPCRKSRKIRNQTSQLHCEVSLYHCLYVTFENVGRREEKVNLPF